MQILEYFCIISRQGRLKGFKHLTLKGNYLQKFQQFGNNPKSCYF